MAVSGAGLFCGASASGTGLDHSSSCSQDALPSAARNRPIEIPAAASSSVMVITEHGGIAACVCLSAYFPFWWVINYITLSLIDLCTLCLDRVTFIAVGPSNIIMAIHHVQGQQRCPF